MAYGPFVAHRAIFCVPHLDKKYSTSVANKNSGMWQDQLLFLSLIWTRLSCNCLKHSTFSRHQSELPAQRK